MPCCSVVGVGGNNRRKNTGLIWDLYESILAWAEAKVFNSTLNWEHGFITFDIAEENAREAASLFIYLWTRGVKAGVAEHCATAYVNSFVRVED